MLRRSWMIYWLCLAFLLLGCPRDDDDDTDDDDDMTGDDDTGDDDDTADDDDATADDDDTSGDDDDVTGDDDTTESGTYTVGGIVECANGSVVAGATVAVYEDLHMDCTMAGCYPTSAPLIVETTADGGGNFELSYAGTPTDPTRSLFAEATGQFCGTGYNFTENPLFPGDWIGTVLVITPFLM